MAAPVQPYDWGPSGPLCLLATWLADTRSAGAMAYPAACTNALASHFAEARGAARSGGVRWGQCWSASQVAHQNPAPALRAQQASALHFTAGVCGLFTVKPPTRGCTRARCSVHSRCHNQWVRARRRGGRLHSAGWSCYKPVGRRWLGWRQVPQGTNRGHLQPKASSVPTSAVLLTWWLPACLLVVMKQLQTMLPAWPNNAAARVARVAATPGSHAVQPWEVQAPLAQLSARQLLQVQCHLSALGSSSGAAALGQRVQPTLRLHALPGHMVLNGAWRQMLERTAAVGSTGMARDGET